MDEARCFSVRELAEAIGGRIASPSEVADRVIRSVAGLQEAGPEAISWVSSEKHARFLPACRAAAIVGTDKLLGAHPNGILVADPERAIGLILERFHIRMEPPPPGIHPTAVVDPSAIIARSARIGAHCVVKAAASIGENTIIHEGVSVGRAVRIGGDCQIFPRCVIYDRCSLGDRVILHAGVVVGADGFGYIFREGRHIRLPHIGTVEIEDDVEIGPNTVVDRGKVGATRIGRGSKIDALVMIAHNVQIGPLCILVAQCGISGSVRLGTGVILAGQAGLSDGLTLADGVKVAAQTGVMSDVEAGKIIHGTPAQEAGEYFRCVARFRKLPQLFEEFAELSRRVEKLEAAADHR